MFLFLLKYWAILTQEGKNHTPISYFGWVETGARERVLPIFYQEALCFGAAPAIAKNKKKLRNAIM